MARHQITFLSVHGRLGHILGIKPNLEESFFLYALISSTWFCSSGKWHNLEHIIFTHHWITRGVVIILKLSNYRFLLFSVGMCRTKECLLSIFRTSVHIRDKI